MMNDPSKEIAKQMSALKLAVIGLIILILLFIGGSALVWYLSNLTMM